MNTIMKIIISIWTIFALFTITTSTTINIIKNDNYTLTDADLINITLAQTDTNITSYINNITIIDEPFDCGIIPANNNITKTSIVGCFTANYGYTHKFLNGEIRIVSSEWINTHTNVNFTWVLKHEIGHAKGHTINYSIGINESYADEYANLHS